MRSQTVVSLSDNEGSLPASAPMLNFSASHEIPVVPGRSRLASGYDARSGRYSAELAVVPAPKFEVKTLSLWV